MKRQIKIPRSIENGEKPQIEEFMCPGLYFERLANLGLYRVRPANIGSNFEIPLVCGRMKKEIKNRERFLM
jgi:hypothetical protein